MKKAYKERTIELVRAYNEDNCMVSNIKAGAHPNDTIWESIIRYLENGECAMYLEDIENDLKKIYGEDYDKTKYYTKGGNLKIRNNTFYMRTVYNNTMGQVIWDLYKDELRKES